MADGPRRSDSSRDRARFVTPTLHCCERAGIEADTAGGPAFQTDLWSYAKKSRLVGTYWAIGGWHAAQRRGVPQPSLNAKPGHPLGNAHGTARSRNAGFATGLHVHSGSRSE